MSRSERGAVWVFHRGALGDSVLLWPMLRALARGGEVVLVADRPRAALAARELGVKALDAEGEQAAGLWVAGGSVRPVPGVASVHAWLGRPGRGRRVWCENARRAFPGAQLTIHDARPDSLLARRWAAWREGDDLRGAGISAAPGDPAAPGDCPAPTSPAGPAESTSPLDRPDRSAREDFVVFHVGAGAAARRWPMDRWLELAGLLESGVPGIRVEWLAGEAEAEAAEATGSVGVASTAGWRGREAALFGGAGGRYLFDLEELAARLRRARLHVGADTGPSHLAAQLGTPTLALFGPSDPTRWAPVGPCVEVVAPPTPRAMRWLDAGSVARAALRLLDARGRAPADAG